MIGYMCDVCDLCSRENHDWWHVVDPLGNPAEVCSSRCLASLAVKYEQLVAEREAASLRRDLTAAKSKRRWRA